ncbi:MAG: signal peptidase I [Phycisphaerae bacterium]|nr:signal peptidase I [Phycisphaerae bacterium]
MEEQQSQPYESFAHRHHHSAENVVTLLEWLLVAFILALVFQGFAVQAFQIPTGSMAETLRGAHHQFRCFRCGYAFDTGKDSYTLDRPQCPNCNYFQPPHAIGSPKNGDRIFVLKCIYAFFEPKHWDVVVFKNPTNPRDNFIKRLVALPGETIQLINGDLFIDGKIMRKPLNVQKELWMPIFVQDFQPLDACDNFDEPIRHGQDTHNTVWMRPFKNENGSEWDLQPTRYSLDDVSDKQHFISFQTDNPNEFRASYAYNNSSGYGYRPVCSDLMITFFAKGQSPDGCIGASLEKYGVIYSAQVNFAGSLLFTKTVDGVATELGRPTLTGGIKPGIFEKFEFANVDQQLVLRWGQKRFSYDLSKDISFRTQDASDESPPTIKIFASGPTEIRHIALYRDIFYVGKEEPALRATVDKPFTLDVDQFFVCGDNCNNSSDARLWSVEGIGNNGKTYRTGTVPREYMMGKAVLVYWSQAFRPPTPKWASKWVPKFPPMIPNLSNIKVIYGGSEQLY